MYNVITTRPPGQLVRATDLDALSCKHSINRNLYLNSGEFVKDLLRATALLTVLCWVHRIIILPCIKRTLQEKKMPIINRGSYLRTRAIDQVVNKFMYEFKDRCQLCHQERLDTRAFQIFKSHANVIYHEIDFPESAKVKNWQFYRILSSGELVGTNETLPLINKEQFESYSRNWLLRSIIFMVLI